MANSVDPDRTAPIEAVCSGSTLFASILNLSVMLGNYLQQTTFSDAFFLVALRVNPCWQIFFCIWDKDIDQSQWSVFSLWWKSFRVTYLLLCTEVVLHGFNLSKHVLITVLVFPAFIWLSENWESHCQSDSERFHWKDMSSPFLTPFDLVQQVRRTHALIYWFDFSRCAMWRLTQVLCKSLSHF